MTVASDKGFVVGGVYRFTEEGLDGFPNFAGCVAKMVQDDGDICPFFDIIDKTGVTVYHGAALLLWRLESPIKQAIEDKIKAYGLFIREASGRTTAVHDTRLGKPVKPLVSRDREYVNKTRDAFQTEFPDTDYFIVEWEL